MQIFYIKIKRCR